MAKAKLQIIKMNFPARTPEYNEALQHYEALKTELTECSNNYDNLVYHKKPILEAEYLQKVGKHKLELLKLQTEMLVLKRKVELIQAAINRNEEFNIEVINLLVETELHEHLQHVEQETKKINNALNTQITALSEEETIRIKELYYLFARRLHPDINPSITEEMKVLWQRVQQAYKALHLASMEALLIVFKNLYYIEENFDLLEEVKKRNDSVSKLIVSFSEKILQIESMFPFTIESSINNPDWINEQVNNTLNEIQRTGEEKTYYTDLFNKLSASSK